MFYISIPAFVIFFAAVFYVKIFVPAPDCHSKPAEQINIVFDKTKPYSDTQAHSIDRTLVEVLTAAMDNAEINLYYITSDPEHPYLVLNQCKPATHGNALLVDVDKQKRDFSRLVIRKVKEKIDLRFAPRSAAPIIESLSTISRQRIVTSKLDDKVNVQFDLYSDMVQVSENVSLEDRNRCTSIVHGTPVDPEGVYGDVKQFFRNIPVHVYGIHRSPATFSAYPGERCIRSFWEDAFPHLTWVAL
jgi:hypothetical protein